MGLCSASPERREHPAIPPNTKTHRPLMEGVYEHSFPARAKLAVNLDGGFYRTRVDPKNVKRALEDRTRRYAIRLPRPDHYEGFLTAGS